MDKSNFDSIINRYLEKFEYTNGKGPEEYFKWIAVDCFQKNWDLNSEDLLGSFTRAISKTGVLLDGGHAAPSSGIKFLLKQPGEVEFVREAFRSLLNPNADLKERDLRVHKFMADINARISKYRPNDSYMPQSSRAALCYLALAHPEQNYFYMYTKAENWAVFTEYGFDLGAGAYFSLPIYYQMCEEVVDEIRKRPQLQECDRIRKQAARVDLDDNYHTLAYDIIYCATTYHLFRDLPIYYPTSVKNRVERAKQQAEIEKLKAEMDRAEVALAEYDGVECKVPDLVGHVVRHKKFGEGTVTEQSEKGLVIRFADSDRKFTYPDAFNLKHLLPSDEDMSAINAAESARKNREQAEKIFVACKEAYNRAVVEFEKKWKKSVHNDAVDENED